MDSFDDLTHAFFTRFILKAEGEYSLKRLFKVKQNQEESLRSFVIKWQAAASKCRDFSKNIGLVTFKEGLLKGKFLCRLNEKFKPATYDEVLAEAIETAQVKYATWGEKPRERSPPKSARGVTTTKVQAPITSSRAEKAGANESGITEETSRKNAKEITISTPSNAQGGVAKKIECIKYK